jgi:hypothetical protein
LLGSLDETLQRSNTPLRCISCGNPVTTHEERFALNGKTEFHFVNSGNYQFDICLYRNALGCYPKGVATSDDSWFPPCRWQHALCDNCDLHIGWLYQDDNGDNFWGLITALLTTS